MDLVCPGYKKHGQVLAKPKNLSSQGKDQGVSAGISFCFFPADAMGGGGISGSFKQITSGGMGWWSHLEPPKPAMPLLFVYSWAAGSREAPERGEKCIRKQFFVNKRW